jgi:hypothetical protein
VYHVEIRESAFHITHAYNLDAERLHANVLNPFARGEIFELAGREWIPQRAKLTILEGDELPLHMLGMSRGWNNARHKGKDVTEELLEATRAKLVAPTVDPDSHGVLVRDILARSAMGPLPLAAVWDRAEFAAPTGSSGEWLVLAQTALSQLLSEGRIVLCRGEDADAAAVAEDEVEPVLRTREAWGTDRASALYVHAA